MSILPSPLSAFHQAQRCILRQISGRGWHQPLRSLHRQGARWLLLAAAVSALCMAPAFGMEGYSSAVDRISRGETITITSTMPLKPAAGETVRLILSDEEGRPIARQLEAQTESADANPQSLTFTLPADLKASRYTAQVQISSAQGKSVPASGAVVFGSSKQRLLMVDPEQGAPAPTIQSINPPIAYPQKDGTYRLKINGTGFSPTPEDNVLRLYAKDDNEGGFRFLSELGVCWQQDSTAKQECRNDWSTGKKISSRQLVVQLKKPQDVGNQAVFGLGIRIGDKTSSPEVQTITLSDRGRWLPLVVSLGILAVLAAIAIFALGSSAKKANVIGLPPQKVIDALLIDPETNTFSLSRAQFLLWTGVAVFGYFYLFLASWLVQGRLHFFDVPDGLPGIVMISAATTSFASGITNTKGSKGSGSINPSWSDFLSAGGSVLPERLQFAIWTLIGASAYLVVTIAQDPGTIETLPTLPPGFLQLSGISSLGYLGGKLARNPGPLINEIKAENVSSNPAEAGALKLTLTGSHLSKDLRFRLQKAAEDSEKPFISSWEFAPDTLAVKLLPEGAPAEEANSAEITITPKTPEENYWCKGDTTKLPKHFHLRVYNPDGQWADWQFYPITLPKAPEDSSSA
ncbi:MAG: hypothetical protein ACK5N0_10610 [Synechococcaceae cyanobacterium]